MNALAAHESTLVNLLHIRTDGGTQPRSALYQNVIDDYADALSAGAKFPPVILFYDGSDYWLADGFHRHSAHKQSGFNEINADIRQGTRRDAVLYSVGANASHGLRRTNEDKRRAIMTLLNDDEWVKWSDREIARRAGVSNNFVSEARKSLSFNDSGSRTYTDKHGNVTTMSTANIGKSAPQEPAILPSNEPTHHPIAANDNKPQTRLEAFSGDNEWYTPGKYIEMARTVMGAIDVDPASNDYAQNTVKAGKFYTAETNGLDKDWSGNVWMNPPYSNPEIQQFVAKAIEEYKSGRCTSAIILTNNSADTGWHHSLQEACTAMCITRGRIRFESPTRESNSPAMGQVFFYFGDDVSSFTKIFSEVGRVWESAK